MLDYIINKVKKYYSDNKEKIRIATINADYTLKYKFLDINKNDKDFLHKYINKVAKEISNKENLKIFNVDFDEMNKDENVEKHKAVGRFVWLNEGVDYDNHIAVLIRYYQFKDVDSLERKTTYPRIELSEKSDVMTLIHELGHYFIYKRKGVQSEDGANLYIEEFFDGLPEFLSWIFQIDIFVRNGQKPRKKYTNMECYTFIDEYKKFKLEQC